MEEKQLTKDQEIRYILNEMKIINEAIERKEIETDMLKRKLKQFEKTLAKVIR